MADIIQFPESRKVRDVPSEFTETIKEEAKQKSIDEFSDFITGALYTNLIANGIKETDIFNDTDFPLIASAIRSAVYRNFGLHHEFQDMVDEAVSIPEEELTEK